MERYIDAVTGKARRGLMDILEELERWFPEPTAIKKEAYKKDFTKLFGEYLRLKNILQNYYDFITW